MRQRLKKIWQSLKIKQKISFFTSIVFLLILLSIFMAVWTVKYSLFDFSVILNSNAAVNDFVQCMEKEAELFEDYVKTGTENTYTELEQAIVYTEKAVAQLPYDYDKTGEKSFAKTWSILNTYQVYCEKREHVLRKGEKTAEYIAALYDVYDMQNYLQSYAKDLMRGTLENGISLYAGKVKTIIAIPIGLLLFELILFFCIGKLSELMHSSIVSPVMDLAEASRKIAKNDFYIDDITVQNEDELGELVVAFNKMKYATGEYIKALEEKRKALDLYHAEELEKLEISARLDAMELDLLKSQINPHFLFNTLNVIGGMANLEEAQTTEAMIQSLSFLFRYNLKTPEKVVSLARELKVVKDYMFLQEMRFGSRITYEIDCQADAELVMIPTFTFQPLVENAIIHGLAQKEEGGRLLIRIRQRRGNICIVVADNGVGMDLDTLRKLRKALREDKAGNVERTSIGLSNIYRRIHMMYEKGSMRIHSKPQVGTMIRIEMENGREHQFET